MKRTKRVVSLLIAAIFIFGMAVTAHAAIPGKSVGKFWQEGKVYGEYPRYNGYDALNSAIYNDIWLIFNGVSGGLGFGLTRDPGAFSNTNPNGWVVISYEEKDDDDFFIVTVTVKTTYSDKTVRSIVNTYYVNSKDKTFSKNDSAKYDAYVSAKENPPAAPSTPPVAPPTPLEQAVALFNKIKAQPILPDASGYVSLKFYADAVGGTIGFNRTTGDVVFAIDNKPLFIYVDDAVWEKGNANLYAPIYIDGDDILVHASLVYPIYTSRITVDARGNLLIVTH